MTAPPIHITFLDGGMRPPAVTAASTVLEFDFDEEKHPRDEHGRWTSGGGGDSRLDKWEKGKEGQTKLYDILMNGGNPDAYMVPGDGWGSLSDEQIGAAKAEIVKAAGADIAEAVRAEGSVYQEMQAQYGEVEPDVGPGETTQRLHLETDWMDAQQGIWTQEELDAKDNATLYGEIKAQEYVDSWAASAADTNPISLALQTITAETLDANSASFNDYLKQQGHSPSGYEEMATVLESKETIRAFVQGEYDRTQALLKSEGIEYVTLYRGMSFGEGGPPSPFHSDGSYVIDMNPASSWSVDRETAEHFADNGPDENSFVLTSYVAAEDIMSTAVTGRGALTEGEVLVRNQPDSEAHVERVGIVDDSPAPWQKGYTE